MRGIIGPDFALKPAGKDGIDRSMQAKRLSQEWADGLIGGLVEKLHWENTL